MKVIFYFTAEWCSPCKRTRPIVEKFIMENENVTLVIIDIDKDQEIAQELNIMTIPHFVLFENEQEISRTTNITNDHDLRHFVHGKH